MRHLVLPNGTCGSDEVILFLAEEIRPTPYRNLMNHDRQCGRANDHPALERPITRRDFRDALDLANRYGLKRLDHVGQRMRWL